MKITSIKICNSFETKAYAGSSVFISLQITISFYGRIFLYR